MNLSNSASDDGIFDNKYIIGIVMVIINFGARFIALWYSDVSPVTGEAFVSIANLPDIEDGQGLLGCRGI